MESVRNNEAEGDKILRSKLMSYCEAIYTAFQNSGLHELAATGISLPFKNRLPLEASCRYNTQDKTDQPNRQINESSAISTPPIYNDRQVTLVTETKNELEFLDRWLATKNMQPLLVTGPFGSGKSGMLAAFTVHLAKIAISKLQQTPVPGQTISIPLPVRLRDWMKYEQETTKVSPCWDGFLVAMQNLFVGHRIKDQILNVRELGELVEHSTFKLVCLYDGLDEVPKPVREKIIGLASKFHKCNSSNGEFHCILSSRDLPDYGLPIRDDHHIRIQELTEDAITLDSVVTRFEPSGQTTDMHRSEKRFGVLGVTGRNAAPAFQMQNGVFNQVAKSIKMLVVRTLKHTILLRWNHWSHRMSCGLFQNIIRVVTPIGNQKVCVESFNKH